MVIFLLGVGVLVVSGVAALLFGRSRWVSVMGAGGAVAGCGLALVPALQALLGGRVDHLRLPWSIPGGTLSLALDPLSGFFLLPTLLLAAAAALYGGEYLATSKQARRVGEAWLWYNLLVASMALTLVAQNAVLFLLAWETMALTSFFLVVFEHEQRGVRRAGWTYLVATHLGTAALLVMFILAAGVVGSFEFSDFTRLAAAPPALTGLVFLLAVVGFGTKAGFVPLHVWLPEAHPAAPSHVSAVMSGVMIKTGIYGLVRAARTGWGRRQCGGGGFSSASVSRRASSGSSSRWRSTISSASWRTTAWRTSGSSRWGWGSGRAGSRGGHARPGRPRVRRRPLARPEPRPVQGPPVSRRRVRRCTPRERVRSIDSAGCSVACPGRARASWWAPRPSRDSHRSTAS